MLENRTKPNIPLSSSSAMVKQDWLTRPPLPHLSHGSEHSTLLIGPSQGKNVTARRTRGVALEPPIDADHMESMATMRQNPDNISINKVHQADCTFWEFPIYCCIVCEPWERPEDGFVEASVWLMTSSTTACSGCVVVVPWKPSYSPTHHDDDDEA